MTTWGIEDLPDQRGRTIIVTGANSGLGAVAARALVGSGARVILACRDVQKAEAVAEQLGDLAEVRRLDLADLASVRAFADSIDTVDVLINNAGVMAVPRGRTADGFERQFGTNHLGHFALTGLLLDKVRDRVVTLASQAHTRGAIDLADLNWERRPYRRWRAYAQSKLANLMFAYEFQRRLTAAGAALISVAAHPGYARTGLQSHTESVQDHLMALGNRILAQSAEMGTLPELFAATAPVEPGAYYGPDGFAGLRGHPVRCGSTAASKDEQVAAELWQASEKLTGITYSFN